MTFVADFLATVARHSESVALEDGDTSFTYAELDALARAASCAVLAKASRGDVIGLQIPKSAELVIAMVGCWYAGVAFAVLAPELPKERSTSMLRDAGVETVFAALPRGSGDVAPLIGNDTELAYVVFTSGSTGRPKGVRVMHRGICPMLRAQIEAFRIDAASRVLWVLSPSFDASISDIGTTLLAGATLVVDREPLHDVWRRVAMARITHVDLPPSVLTRLSETALPTTLRTIVIGGEVCPDATIARFASRVRLVNVYGPTEATVCTSLGVCVPGRAHDGRIGRPIANARYRVEGGELWIGGDCLAEGYANDAAATAQRFTIEAGERWYRTGDLVRAGEDGELRFVGRVDRQVKIAGVRIEPEEIETRLREDPAVFDAAVTPVGGRLVAFVVLTEQDGDVTAVRERLRRALPPWLVPSRIVVTTSLERNAAGKIDSRGSAVIPPPRTPREKILCEAAAHALGLAGVGPDEDFFDLGADSLAVLDLCAGAEIHGIDVSPDVVTRARTAARLAKSISNAAPIVELLRDVDAAAAGLRPARTQTTPPRAILLTGATGFLGRRLHDELVRRGAAVTGLIRRPSNNMPAHVAGDLTRDQFGLEPGRYASLAAEVDTIVHCAAEVNLSSSREELLPTNVGGTARILRFAQDGRPKTLHHVSTLSVFSATDRAGRFEEDADPLDATKVHGGYAQSKWIAEALVRRIAPTSYVYRLGLLVPTHDLLRAFVRDVARVGALPNDLDLDALRFDVTPVDFAARALAHFVMHPMRHVHHIANARPATLRDLRAAMQDEGIAIESVLRTDWIARSPSGASLLVTVPMRRRDIDLFEATSNDFASETTLAELEGVGILCPEPTRELLRAYVRAARSS